MVFKGKNLGAGSNFTTASRTITLPIYVWGDLETLKELKKTRDYKKILSEIICEELRHQEAKQLILDSR